MGLERLNLWVKAAYPAGKTQIMKKVFSLCLLPFLARTLSLYGSILVAKFSASMIWGNWLTLI